MVKSLVISNYALIENLNIQFDKGLTIITGETGAGKSIILGAMALIMGQRADTSVIQNPEKKCYVEAIFDITNYNLKPFFIKNDIDYFDQTIIRREISPEGRSRAFINDSPVNLSVLKEISSKLIDIHSQHDTLLLNNKEFQIEVLDFYAKNSDLLDEYRTLFKKFKSEKSELEILVQKSAKEKSDYDYYQYQFNQLEEANLQLGEQEQLEIEQKQLSHSEEIKQNLSKLNFLLNNDDLSIISMLKDALRSVDNISEYMDNAKEIYERLDSSLIELQDLSTETEVLENDLDIDPQRLEYVNQRLDLIYSLEHKFNVENIADLLNLKQDLEQKLLQINSYDEKIEEKNKLIADLDKKLSVLTEKLTKSRLKVKTNFEKKIETLSESLGMPNAKFIVEIEKTKEYTNTGTDKITFLFSANKNIPVQSIAKIASGGELSRLMLSLKYVISQSKTLPTIIFDEIDTGISGEIADKMGRLLRDMSENIQIINITHLPQIAAKGHNHFKVYKEDNSEKTISKIEKLDDENRIKEIAKMLSGANITESAIQNAKELLNS
jgi:DNA repair protein RecN (Recombination protein N)